MDHKAHPYLRNINISKRHSIEEIQYLLKVNKIKFKMFLRNSCIKLKPFTAVLNAMVRYSSLFRIKTLITLAMKRIPTQVSSWGNPSFKDLHDTGLKPLLRLHYSSSSPSTQLCFTPSYSWDTTPKRSDMQISVSEYVA